MKISLRNLVLTLCFIAISQGLASAQTSGWNTSTTGSWSTATWSGGTPTVGGTSTQVITFFTSGSPTAGFTSTVDSGITSSGTFNLNKLNLNSAATTAFTITINGAGLNFNGASGNLINFNELNGSNAGTSYTVANAITFINGLTINATNAGFNSGSQPPNVISGGITGSGGLTITGAGMISFTTNASSYTGGLFLNGSGRYYLNTNVNTTGTTTLNSGALIIQTNNVLGSTGQLLILNGGTVQAQNAQTLTNATQVTNNILLGDGTNIGNGFQLTLSGTMLLAGTGGLISVDLTTPGGSAQYAKITGAISDTGGAGAAINKSGAGLLALATSGTNTYSGGTNIYRGAVEFKQDSDVPVTGTIFIGGAGSINAAPVTGGTGAEGGTVQGWLNSGKISTTSNGAIALTANSSANINFSTGGYNNLMLGANVASTYTGTITPGSNGYNLGGGSSVLTLSNNDALTGSNVVNIGALGQPALLKNGTLVSGFASTGTVVLTNTNSTSGVTTINSGTLKLSATATNTFGALPNSTINVNNGATFAVDSVNATVIPSSVTRVAAVNLNSGKMTVSTETGTLVAPGSSSDVITGALTFNSGFSTLTLTGSAGFSSKLTAGSLASNGGEGLVNGVNLGNGAPGTAGTVSVLFGTTPTITGTGSFASGLTGSTSTSKGLAIIPYLVGEVGTTAGNGGTATGVANTFLTYDTTNGLRPLDLSNEYDTLANLNAGTATGNNIRVTATGTATTSNAVNSLVVTGTGTVATTLSITDGQTLTDLSGALLFNGSATTYSINPTGTSGALAFGSNAANITVSGASTSTIKAVVTGTGGLNKYGTGTLVLSGTSNTLSGNITLGSGNMTISGPNTNLTGTTTVLAGTLSVGNVNALGTSTVYLGDTSGSAAVGLTITSPTLTTGHTVIIQSGNIGTVTLNHSDGVSNDKSNINVQLGSTNGTGHGVTITSGALNGFSGVFSDPTGLVGAGGVVTINGSGSVTYFGNSSNSYSGGTVINSGVLSIGGSGTAFGTGQVVLNGGSFNQITGGTTVAGYSTLILNADLTLSNNAGLKLTGTYVNLGATGSTLTRTISSGASNPGVGFDLELGGIIQDGSNGFTKSVLFNGGGYTILTGASTYTGTTTIAGGVQVQVNSVGTVSGTSTSNLGQPGAGSSTIQFGSTTTSGTLVYKGGNAITDRGINLAGTTGGATLVGSGSGTLTISGSVTATGLGAKSLTLAGTKTGNVLSGDISDSAGGATSVVQNDTGGWALSGNNTYTGGTSIITGTVTTGSASALGSGQVAMSAQSTAKLVLASDLTIDSLTTVLVKPTISSGGTGYSTATVAISAPYPGGTAATATLSTSGGAVSSISMTNLGTNYSSAPTYTVSGGNGDAVINPNYAASSVSLGSNTLTFTGTGTSAYGGNISGTGGSLIKNGVGTQVLGGTNSYTGTTSINAGALVVDGIISGTGTVTVGNNTAVATLAGNGRVNGSVTTSTTGSNVAHISPGDAVSPIGTLTIAGTNFTIGDGTVFDFNLTTNSSQGGTANDLINMIGGTLTIGGTTTFNFNNSAVTLGDSYTLLTGAVSISNFNASNFYATNTGTMTTTFSTDGNTIYVVFTSGVVTPTSAYFNGLGSNLGTAGNFDATVSGTVANLGAPGATTNVFISANRNTATSLVTSAPQTINSLNFGVGSGTNSGITVSGTSALTITGSAVNGNTAGSGITTTGTGSNTISAPLVLGASQTWTVDTGGTLTVSGTVSGSGTSLTKSGAGKLVLSGSNTYDGGTTLAVGTLVAANSTTTSAGAIVNGPFGKGTLTLNGGTTLQDNGTAITLANNLSLGGTITLSSTGAGSLTFDGTTLTAPATVTLTSDTTLNVLNTTTIVDNITGNFVLTKIGAGTLNLTGTTTSTAATTVTTGTLSIAKGNSIGSGAISLANATTLQYTGANGTVGQNITVTSGSATINNSGSNVLTLSGTLNKNGTTLNISGGLNVITGQIVGSSANSDVNYINHTTTGLTNTSTYNGPTTISGTSTLLTGVNNALPVTTFTDLTMGASSDVATSVNTLDLLGTSQTVASLTSTGTGTNQIISSNGNASTPTIGAGASTGTGTLTVNVTSGTSTYGGLLGDSNLSRNANNFSLTKSGTGTLALTRSTGNTYTGGTTISAGTLKVSNTSGSATGSGAFNLGSLGIVTGTGTIASSSNTITGNVTPGNGGGDTTSVLTMTATGTTTFTNASLTFNLGTGANLGQSTSLAFGSTASVLFGTSGTSLTLNLASGPIVPDTTQYVLFTSTSSTNPFSDLVTDGNGHILNFGSLIINSSQPNGYYANSYLKLITLGGGAGFNIDVEVVPEPGTWALMLGGLALLVICQRARRKNS